MILSSTVIAHNICALKDNLLINDKNEILVCDFGLARMLRGAPSDLTTLGAGTMIYMAAELFSDERSSTASDVWAFGLVALEVGLHDSLCFSSYPYMYLLM